MEPTWPDDDVWTESGRSLGSRVSFEALSSRISSINPDPASQDVGAVYNHKCFFNVHFGSPAAGNGKLIFIDSGAACHVCPLRLMGRRKTRDHT